MFLYLNGRLFPFLLFFQILGSPSVSSNPGSIKSARLSIFHHYLLLCIPSFFLPNSVFANSSTQVIKEDRQATLFFSRRFLFQSSSSLYSASSLFRVSFFSFLSVLTCVSYTMSSSDFSKTNSEGSNSPPNFPSFYPRSFFISFSYYPHFFPSKG